MEPDSSQPTPKTPLIHPVKLEGAWDEGYALDRHVVSSTLIGEDAFGHPQYETVRTALGEALYRFKYRNDFNTLNTILAIMEPFLDEWKALQVVDVVLPVPPSKKNRLYQPAFEIAQKVAEYLKKPFSEEVLIKTTDEQLKNQSSDEKSIITGSIKQLRPAKRPCNLLLVDDLFQSGATIAECVKVLRQDKLIEKIYVLAITKTARESEI
jgi:predicted amidophosphoribosyltransferase